MQKSRFIKNLYEGLSHQVTQNSEGSSLLSGYVRSVTPGVKVLILIEPEGEQLSTGA